MARMSDSVRPNTVKIRLTPDALARSIGVLMSISQADPPCLICRAISLIFDVTQRRDTSLEAKRLVRRRRDLPSSARYALGASYPGATFRQRGLRLDRYARNDDAPKQPRRQRRVVPLPNRRPLIARVLPRCSGTSAFRRENDQ